MPFIKATLVRETRGKVNFVSQIVIYKGGRAREGRASYTVPQMEAGFFCLGVKKEKKKKMSRGALPAHTAPAIDLP